MPLQDPVYEVAENIYQLRVPLPFALRIVNIYLLRGARGWTVVDTGIHWPAGEAAWRNAFEQLRFGPGDIEQIVLTHFHPDHFGLAGWLQGLAADAGRMVPVYVSPVEAEQVRKVWQREQPIDFGEWMRSNGMPVGMARQVADSLGDTNMMTLPHPTRLSMIEPDSTVTLGEREFRTIHAPGHSDGQLLFYDTDDRLLLSGDHVLMHITPNIGLWTETAPKPLARFITSLRDLHDMDVRLALPGHKRLIEDWSGRIDELIGHHDERLQHVLDAIADGLHTPYEVALRIFLTERFTAHEWRFAIAETLAHLEYLEDAGRLIRDESGRYELI